MTSEKQYFIGSDLGGTNAVYGIVDRAGNIICEDSIKTQDYPNADIFVEQSLDCLAPMLEKVGGINNVQGMGIGAPNANYYSGAIEYPPNLPWKGVTPLARMFSERLGIPVTITNDANAAALGEMTYGAAQGMKDFILVTLGTGVGSGIVVNGNLVYGHDGFAGEFGHVIVDRALTARLCGCGRRGCLETYCSARGICQTARKQLITSSAPSILREIPTEDLSPLIIAQAARQGDAMALEIFRQTGQRLGEACADFATFSSPEAFIFFGGPMRSGEFILPHIVSAYNANVYPAFRGKAKFLISSFMDKNAAVLGAATLAIKECKE